MSTLKIGVFGASRGKAMIETVSKYPGVELVAICDKYEPLLKECEQLASVHNTNVKLFTNFEDFFKADMDAVILANYANEHAPYAIRLLRSGRHVASEVLPVKNMAEAVALVEAVEETGKVYAYLENYCYMPACAEMRRLYKSGVLGELKHAEGEYVHNCGPIWLDITYGEKNHWRNRESSTYYCTHGLGPIIHATGLIPTRVIGIESTPSERMMDLGSPRTDGAMVIVQFNNGSMCKELQGNMLREPSSIWYCLYGSKGSAESNRIDGGVNTINLYLESEGGWMKPYTPEPVNQSELAKMISGHGGGDFYTIHYFIQKILGNEEGNESIGVYEALDMGLPGILAYKSICNGSVPEMYPDLRNKDIRDKYRNDIWSSFEDGEYRLVNKEKEVNIPDEVYDKLRKQWLDSQKNK